jgi:Fe-S-cluster containining protein
MIKSFERSEKDFMKAFECKQCGACCYGEGGIGVESDEVERIARFLALAPDSFVQKYCREKNGRLYIISRADGFCAFYDPEKRCLIHPVKPRPCSLWPFYPALLKEKENWEMARDACPGINPNCSFEDFVRQSKE